MRRSSVESMVSMQRGEAIVSNESDDTIKEKHSECTHSKHCEDDDRYNKVIKSAMCEQRPSHNYPLFRHSRFENQLAFRAHSENAKDPNRVVAATIVTCGRWISSS